MTSVRVIVQQCLSARLQVRPATGEEANDAEYVEIERGVIFYVCLLKGAQADGLAKIVKSLVNVRLSYCEELSKNASVLDVHGDILVVPQASLGGRMKGKNVQYHSNLPKEEGEVLYREFVSLVEEEVKSTGTDSHSPAVKHGTYGNRQVLSVVTNGPFTHIFDF